MDMSQAQFDKFSAQTDAEMAQSQKQYDSQMALQSRALDQADAAALVSKQFADKQMAAVDQNMQFAQEDRDRYTQTFLPLQDQFIAEAQAYDTPERREQAASQALVDNQRQLDAQKNATASQLASMGVDPSQVMSTSLANQMGVAGAANGAMNANASRLQVENEGRQLRTQAIDMGNGLPAQSQAGYQTATQSGATGASAVNSATSGYSTASGIGATAAGIRQNSLNTASSITGSPMAWAQLGSASYGGASNGIMNASSITNQGFQNEMSVQKMKNDQAAQTMQAVGSIASIAGMAMMAEGGVVGEDGLPPIDWGTYDPGVQISAPDTSIRIDQSAPVSAITDHVKASGGSKLGTGMAMAGSAMQSMGKAEQSSADPNLSKQWLQPIMYHRAEGGPMPQGMGGAAPESEYKVMPNMQARDKFPTMLGHGEVVVPADVVRTKGLEFFDKLIAKHHRPGS